MTKTVFCILGFFNRSIDSDDSGRRRRFVIPVLWFFSPPNPQRIQFSIYRVGSTPPTHAPSALPRSRRLIHQVAIPRNPRNMRRRRRRRSRRRVRAQSKPSRGLDAAAEEEAEAAGGVEEGPLELAAAGAGGVGEEEAEAGEGGVELAVGADAGEGGVGGEADGVFDEAPAGAGEEGVVAEGGDGGADVVLGGFDAGEGGEGGEGGEVQGADEVECWRVSLGRGLKGEGRTFGCSGDMVRGVQGWDRWGPRIAGGADDMQAIRWICGDAKR